MKKSELKIIAIFLGIMIIPWIILFYMLDIGDIGKLWKVMTHGTEWIIIILSLCVTGFVLHKKFHQTFTLKEYIVGSVVLTISALATIMLMFYSTTDLADDDRLNSKIMYVKWEEAHESSYEVCVSMDKDGNCEHYETRCSYVPDRYIAYDSIGNSFSISGKQFFTIGKYFGTPMKKKWHNYMNDHCKDGYWYYYHWNGSKNTCIPSSKKHHYVNYIKASHSVLKYYGQIKGYEDYIANYPEVYQGQFGKFYLDRVIDTELLVPDYWKIAVNNELCFHNSYLGPSKEINLLVYFTNQDRGFLYALHEAWCGGKKNDLVVIVGMKNFPHIEWVEIMSWTPHEAFKIKLRDNILGMNTLTNQDEFVQTIVDQVIAPGEDGFKRLEMSTLKYLISDIILPWWAYIISSLIIILLYLPILLWFFHNEEGIPLKKSSRWDNISSYSKFKKKY